jgi:hypothetical protein
MPRTILALRARRRRLLHADHLDQLAPPGDQLGQDLGLLIEHRPRLGAHLLGEARDQLGVEPVGLGQAADSACEGADPGRVDHGERQAGGDRGPRDRDLEATGRLEHGKLGADRGQARHERLEALAVAGHREPFGRGAQVYVEPIMETSISTNISPHDEAASTARVWGSGVVKRP